MEPPVAAMPAMALRSARRSRNVRADGPPLAASETAEAAAARSAAAPFSSVASAAISPSPMGEMPRQSRATAIVFAVKWPAQVPGPGQASRSSSSSSSRVAEPRSKAPTASHTCWIVTSAPRTRPARIGPL